MSGTRGSTSSPCFALAIDTFAPFIDVRNNILYNTQTTVGTGRSYAIGLAGSSYGSLTSDRNVMFTSGTSARFAVVGGFTNTPAGDKTTLALWQSTTGKDANSVSADPRFVNPASDLHIQNSGAIVSPAAILAAPITGVTTDFDGDARPSNPDAGADEFVTCEMNATAIGPGTVSKSPNQPTYNPGVTVQLTATANVDGLFTGWTGDAGGSTNPLSVVMNTTKNIQAQFQQRGLSVLDVSLLEGTGIPGYATFQVFTDLAPSQAVSVTLSTFGGSAHSYGGTPDYDSTHVVLIFQPGVLDTQTVDVAVFSDPNFEPDETFRLAIVNAEGFGVADSSGTCTIQNDDSPPAIYCFDSTGPEGTGGTGLRAIQVNLTGASYLPIEFKARTVDGTATVADNDYQAISPPQTFIIPPETQAISVFVTVVRDANIEPNEYFDVVLSNPVNASIQDSTGRITLQDDDTPTQVNIEDGEIVEGAAAHITLEVLVTGPIPPETITVQYQTFGGTATAGVDYTAVSPPQTIDLEGGRGYATIPLLDDSDPEGAETIQVRILNPSVGVLGDSIGVGTILDDDETVPPTVTLVAPNGGESWPVGSTQNVTWTASDNVGVQYVALDLSADGGTTWQVVDQVLAEPAVYSWFVPNQPTGAAIMRIRAYDYAGNPAEDVSNAYFQIPGVTGVAETPPAFFMAPAAPNPFLGATMVSYSLDRDGPVLLEVFDVLGRRRVVLVDGPEAKGPHAVRWDGRDARGSAVPSGLYVLRLTFPGHVARERVLRIR
ncbi:MAG TPA: Calx-beta domain-containing protein, partial [Candidatus Eisenbacteria bacterium]|nr:Calx-beta domain-containing protein [Candidatus Eisenbacteria bacterium]